MTTAMSARRRAALRRMAAAVGVLVLSVAAASSWAQNRDVAPRRKAVEPAGQTRLSGEAWAVVIGINEYEHQRGPKLRYAVNDARSVQRVLGRLGFRPERITTLLDADATKTRIEAVLGDDLHRKVGPDDRVFVFFAGHGKTDRLRSGEDEGYLNTNRLSVAPSKPNGRQAGCHSQRGVRERRASCVSTTSLPRASWRAGPASRPEDACVACGI